MIERETGFSHNIQLVHERGPVILRERSGVMLHMSQPISMRNLLGSVPEREEIQAWPAQYILPVGGFSAKRLYADLASEPAKGFFVTRRNSKEKEYLVVGPSFNGLRINALQYFAAPFKGDGFDAFDAHHHIEELFGSKEANVQARLARHRRMKGWAEFEGSAERIRRTIHDYYFDRDKTTEITPVFRWRKNEQGQREILLDPFKGGMKSAIMEAIPSVNPRLLDGGLGLLYLAAYSPDQTQWPQRSGYGRAKKKVGQYIGPSQVMAFAFRRLAETHARMEVAANEDLQNSPILQEWEQHIALRHGLRAA